MSGSGLVIGAGTFLIIGLLHPVVIKTEYYFGKGVWPLFLLAGLACLAGSLFLRPVVASSLLAVWGFSLLWSIRELFEQEERVQKGWFPSNPNRRQPEGGEAARQAGRKP